MLSVVFLVKNKRRYRYKKTSVQDENALMFLQLKKKISWYYVLFFNIKKCGKNLPVLRKRTIDSPIAYTAQVIFCGKTQL